MLKYQDVNMYINCADEAAQPSLHELRKIILEVVPEVEEKISYNVPFYKYYGELVGFSLAKHHVSFGFGPNVLKDEDRLYLEKKGYKLGKGTLQIKFDQAIPSKEIENMISIKANANKQNYEMMKK